MSDKKFPNIKALLKQNRAKIQRRVQMHKSMYTKQAGLRLNYYWRVKEIEGKGNLMFYCSMYSMML